MIKSIKFDNKMILLLVAGIILLASVVMLSRMNEGDQKSIVHKVAADADRYMAGDVEGLVKNADYIVSGKFERSSEAWEMRKEPYYKEGDLYNFKVDTNLLGDLTEIIKVGIPHFQNIWN